MKFRDLGMHTVRPKTTKISDAPWWLPPPRARPKFRHTAIVVPCFGVQWLKHKDTVQVMKMHMPLLQKKKPSTFGSLIDIVEIAPHALLQNFLVHLSSVPVTSYHRIAAFVAHSKPWTIGFETICAKAI